MYRSIRIISLIAPLAVVACHANTAAPGASLKPDSLAIRRDIDYLASERLAGRLTGTAGNDSAAAYIARRYTALGLEPGAPGYQQHFVARPASHAGPGPSLATQNVFAILPGSDRALRGEYVIIGAHFDHLGTSTDGALDPEAKNAVRRGADDNASGTAAVLELARIFAAKPARRSIIFANFTGEEQGILGSTYFTEHLPIAVDSVDAMLNFDMVGRLKDNKLIVYGVGTAPELSAIVDSANGRDPFALSKQPDGFGPSDHSAFYAKKIPVLHFFTDLHDDYHRASDLPDRINGAGEARVVALAERIAREVADRPTRLTYAFIAAKASTASREGSTDVYFGSIPDMASSDSPGLKLTGVRAGSPADVAGIKAGDIIVEFGGTPVKDLYEYSDALYAHKPGDVVKVVVVRDGKRVTVAVTLGKRGG